MSRGTDEINAALNAAHENGRHVKAMAFGYGDSYIISYGSETETNWLGPLGTKWNLKGHYRGMSEFKYRSIMVRSQTPCFISAVHSGKLTVSFPGCYTRHAQRNRLYNGVPR